MKASSEPGILPGTEDAFVSKVFTDVYSGILKGKCRENTGFYLTYTGLYCAIRLFFRKSFVTLIQKKRLLRFEPISSGT